MKEREGKVHILPCEAGQLPQRHQPYFILALVQVTLTVKEFVTLFLFMASVEEQNVTS